MRVPMAELLERVEVRLSSPLTNVTLKACVKAALGALMTPLTASECEGSGSSAKTKSRMYEAVYSLVHNEDLSWEIVDAVNAVVYSYVEGKRKRDT